MRSMGYRLQAAGCRLQVQTVLVLDPELQAPVRSRNLKPEA
jgi:hypothetical protein